MSKQTPAGPDWPIWALALVVVYVGLSWPGAAAAKCSKVDDDTIRCDKRTIVELRNGDRAADALCQLLQPRLDALPSKVDRVCRRYASTARWIVQARQYREMKKRALSVESKLNACEGAKTECRNVRKTLRRRNRRLSESETAWKIAAAIATVAALGGGIFIGLDAAGAIEFGSD